MTTKAMHSPEELESLLKEAAEQLKGLQTIDDMRAWWRKHYLTLGHKKLGRLLLGQSIDTLVERSKRRAEID